MFQRPTDMYEHGVAATNDQRDVGFKGAEVGHWRVGGNPWRIKVRFVMVNSVERFCEREGGGLSRLQADHECVGKAGALRGGDGVDLAGCDLGLGQSGLSDGKPIAQMLARGQLGHDASVFGMQLNLRRDNVGEDLAIAHDRGAGLVARSFDGKEQQS